MKLRVGFFAMMLALAASSPAAEIGDVKTVYLLPMSNALDQFLAMLLTSAIVLQVVTDPKRADAILSDRIGAGLDQKLDELYKTKPAPPPPSTGSQKPLDDSDKPVVQPLSHASGTIFLIDRKTRNVIWSVYERPKTTSPDDLNRIADRIAAKLAKDLKGK